MTNKRRERMKVELACTLKIQGIWRGVSCREAFRRKGIHISSPLEEYVRSPFHKLPHELPCLLFSTSLFSPGLKIGFANTQSCAKRSRDQLLSFHQ